MAYTNDQLIDAGTIKEVANNLRPKTDVWFKVKRVERAGNTFVKIIYDAINSRDESIVVKMTAVIKNNNGTYSATSTLPAKSSYVDNWNMIDLGGKTIDDVGFILVDIADGSFMYFFDLGSQESGSGSGYPEDNAIFSCINMTANHFNDAIGKVFVTTLAGEDVTNETDITNRDSDYQVIPGDIVLFRERGSSTKIYGIGIVLDHGNIINGDMFHIKFISETPTDMSDIPDNETIVVNEDNKLQANYVSNSFPRIRYENGHLYADYPAGASVYDGASNPAAVSAPEGGGVVSGFGD